MTNESEMNDSPENLPVTLDPARSLHTPRRKSFVQSMRDFWLILRYALKFWPSLLMIGLVGLVGAVLAPGAAFMFAAAIDTFFGMVSPDSALTRQSQGDDGFSIGQIAEQIIQRLSDTLGFEGAALLIVIVLAFTAASLLFQATLFVNRWLSFLVSMKAFYALQRDLYDNILSQSISFFHRERVGDLISRVHNDVSAVTSPMTEVIQSLSSRIITLTVLVFLMVRTSPTVTLIVLGIGGSTALVPALLGRRFQGYMSQQQSQQALVVSVIQEALSAARLVKSVSSEEREVNKYWQRAMRMFRVQKRTRLFRLIVDRSSEISTVIGIGALLAVGGSLISSGEISMVEYAAFIYIAREAGVLVAGLSSNLMLVYGVLGASERVVELLKTRPSIVDGDTTKREFNDQIELRNASFGYGNGHVLQDISLTIRKGEFIAIVGPSGGGKSTILDLLLRLQDPTAGQVLMDGEDIRSFTQKEYRRMFGVVSQETLLFNDTVYSNIAYSANGISKAQVEQAAKAANAHGFIELLPHAYDTFVGDRGVRVSGGERQRLAIARALASEPQILLFDEATSSLDTTSERQVQEAIDQLVGTRTAVVVAHRLSTIARADRIYVIDKGRIAESGSHDELKRQCGIYSRLLGLQGHEDKPEPSVEMPVQVSD